jgi:hypothetical protein
MPDALGLMLKKKLIPRSGKLSALTFFLIHHFQTSKSLDNQDYTVNHQPFLSGKKTSNKQNKPNCFQQKAPHQKAEG